MNSKSLLFSLFCFTTLVSCGDSEDFTAAEKTIVQFYKSTKAKNYTAIDTLFAPELKAEVMPALKHRDSVFGTVESYERVGYSFDYNTERINKIKLNYLVKYSSGTEIYEGFELEGEDLSYKIVDIVHDEKPEE
jgi:hypothetical protein